MKCRKLLAITLAAMMAMGTMTMAFAEDSGSVSYDDYKPHEIDGNVVGTTDPAVAVSGAGTSVTVSGSVTNDNGKGVKAESYGTAKVAEDVTASTTAVYATNASNVTVGGDATSEGSDTGSNACAVYAYYGSTVTVEGDATRTGDNGSAVVAGTQSTVTVQGDATVEGKNGYAVYADNGTATVYGNATADSDYSYAVYANNSTVTVEGDVSASGTRGYGVVASGSTVTVNGDVTGSNDQGQAVSATNSNIFIGGDVITDYTDWDDGYGVEITVSGDSQEEPYTVIVEGDIATGDDYSNLRVNLGGTLDEGTELSDLVEIAVGSVNPDKVVAYDSEYNDLTETLLASIRYIVSVDEESAAVNYTGTEEFYDYDTAYSGNKIIVSSGKKGYKIDDLTAGQYATVTKNKNGTWTVLVNDGGNLVLCATLVKNSDGTVTVVDTSATTRTKTTTAKYTVGSKVYMNGGAWILVGIDDEGIWTLRSLRAFKEAELTDREAVLESMLTVAELADVLTTEAGGHVQEIDDGGHIVIRCERGILTASL